MNPEGLRRYRWVISAEEQGQRLDVYLTSRAELGLSRSRIQDLIRQEAVLLDGAPTKPGYIISQGQEVTVEVEPPRRLNLDPEPIPLEVVFEDEDLVVINKQRGLVVHPAPGHPSGTLVNALLHRCGDLAGIGGTLRPGIVHRLDKDTTGLMVAAKTDLAHQGLVRQLRSRRIKREYLALVHGAPVVESGIVDAPIGRHKIDRFRMAVTPGRGEGKEAVTRFWVQERLGEYALVLCQLETGRTHQIRVHLDFIGHPVVGDPLYGRRSNPWNLEGQALHARRLRLQHPRSSEDMQFCAPLPEDVARILASLREEGGNPGSSGQDKPPIL